MKMNFFKLLKMLNMFGSYIDGAEQGGSDNTEDTQDPEAQRILDAIANGETDFQEAPADEDTKLPSDEDGENDQDEEKPNDDGELLAGKYKNTDELKKGITNLKSTLPEYVLNGMTDEALIQHYNELELEFSKGRKHVKKEEVKEEKPEDKPDDKPKEKPTEAGKIPDDVWTDLSDSFAKDGGLSESQYEKLEGYGIPSQIVDGYIDGLVAKQNTFANEVHALAGGKEEYDAMKAWASDGNIDTSYLESLSTMPEAQAKNAMLGIKAQYDMANKSERKIVSRVVGSSKSSGNNGSYNSQDDYIKDVSDARYNSDETFRKKVDLKLSKSKF